MGWAYGTQGEDEIFVGKPAGRCPLKDQRLDLNGDVDGRRTMDLCGYDQEQVEGCFEKGNETWPSQQMSASRVKLCSMELYETTLGKSL